VLRFARITPGQLLAHTDAVKRDFLHANRPIGTHGARPFEPAGSGRRWLLWSALVRLQVRKSGARVEAHVQPPGMKVQVDRTMLQQVLLNLTRNAIQAMEQDTPLPDRVLRLDIRAGLHTRVQFEVQNRGPGITPDVAQRPLAPFFTTRAGGMGLGLILCRTVVEQHGGTLEYDGAAASGAGSGCCFRFTVPHAGDTAGAQ